MLADLIHKTRNHRSLLISDSAFIPLDEKPCRSVAYLPPKKFEGIRPILKISKFETAYWIIPQSFYNFLDTHRNEFFAFLLEQLESKSSYHWRNAASLVICAERNIEIDINNDHYAISHYSEDNRYAVVSFDLQRFRGIDSYRVSDMQHNKVKLFTAEDINVKHSFIVKQPSIFDDDIDWSRSETVGFDLLELSLYRFLADNSQIN